MEYHNLTPCQPLNLSEGVVRFTYVAEAYIQPIILACGFLANLASLVVLRMVRMNEVFRICLMSLSVVDALACLAGFVQLIVEVVYFRGEICQGYMDPHAIASNTLYFTYMMFMCASASNVILIAGIRNLFVLRPLKSRVYFTERVTMLLCIISLLLTLVVFLPVSAYVIGQSCELEVNNSLCDWMNSTGVEKFANIYVHYVLSTLYGPVIIIIYIVCVISIRMTVKKSVKTLTLITRKASEGSSKCRDTGKEVSTPSRSKTAARITKTLLVILILDVCCTLPYVIQGVGLLVAKGYKGHIFDDESDAGKVYDAIVEICLNLRPSYNFWLYVFQHPDFRARLRLLLRKMSMPCYSSDHCPCCKLPPDTGRSTPNWSSTPSTGGEKGPWFRRLTSKQPPKDTAFVQVMPTNITNSAILKKDTMASFDSDSGMHSNGSYV